MELAMILKLVALLLITGMGAVAYRWRGMNRDTVPAFLRPKIVRVLVYTSVLGVASVIAGGNIIAAVKIFTDVPAIFNNAIVSGICTYFFITGLSLFGTLIGHGSYFYRPNSDKNEDNEIFSPITNLVENPMGTLGRLVGMSLTGLAITLPICLIPGVSFIYGVVGVAKGLIYTYICRNTEHAEPAWGGVSAGLLAACAFI
jgi:hypothetical protein